MHVIPPNPIGYQQFEILNPRWRMVAISKIKTSRYLQNRLADFDIILHSDALGLRTLAAVQIFK